MTETNNEAFRFKFDPNQPIEPQIWKMFDQWTGLGESVYDLLPAYDNAVEDTTRKSQEIVESIAQKHHLSYTEIPQFNKYQDFREAVAKNWLAKMLAFRYLAEKNGFQKLENVDQDTLNISSMALMTENASTILFGPGAFDTDGEGAAYIYQRMGLRWDPNVHDEGTVGQNPVRRYLREIPQLNVELPIFYKKSPEQREILPHTRTSKIVKAYHRQGQPTIDAGNLQQQIALTFNKINQHTLPLPRS